jgi:hypothetical protein
MSLYPVEMTIQHQPHHYMRSYALEDAVQQWEQSSTVYEEERSGVANGPETLMTAEQAKHYVTRHESTMLDDGQSIVLRVCRDEDTIVTVHEVSVELSEEDIAVISSTRNNATRYFGLEWANNALPNVERVLFQELLRLGCNDSELISYVPTSVGTMTSFKVHTSRPKPNAIHDRYKVSFLYHS